MDDALNYPSDMYRDPVSGNTLLGSFDEPKAFVLVGSSNEAQVLMNGRPAMIDAIMVDQSEKSSLLFTSGIGVPIAICGTGWVFE